MRFSDVMLSVSVVGLAAAEPSPARIPAHCSNNPNGGIECLIGPAPTTATVHTQAATKKVHVHTETATAFFPIATTTVPSTTVTVRAIPTATETRYGLTLATPSNAGSRRYSVPGLFMLPRHIMGLMAGAKSAAAGAAAKTVTKVATELTKVIPFSEVTETTPVVVATVTTTLSKKTETVKLQPKTEIALNPSDEFQTTMFTPVKTETVKLQPKTEIVLNPQPKPTVPVTVPVIETTTETTTQTIPVAVTETKSTVPGTVIETSTAIETSTVIGTNTFWVFPTLDVQYHPQPVTVPSLSDEPTITTTSTTRQYTTTTQINTKRVFTPVTRTVTATGGATQSAQPPKVFSLLGSLLRR